MLKKTKRVFKFNKYSTNVITINEQDETNEDDSDTNIINVNNEDDSDTNIINADNINFDTNTDSDSIFVSIASYRDPECTKTIEDLFLKAKYPDRIFVGVCQQNDPKDKDCLNSQIIDTFKENIRILRLSHYDAKGPLYARALIEQNLFNDEMFYLQIDSHMLFVQDWDVKLIQQLAKCDSDRPILTTYPHDFDRIGRKHLILPNGQRKPLESVPPTFIHFREFHKKLHFSEQEKNIFTDFPDRPYPSLLWAAGFSFTLGKLIHQVPYDEFCDYVFVGEEMLMSMRYYTHGWDFFSPSINIVYHLLKRTYRKVFWEQVYARNCVVNDNTRLMRKQLESQGIKRIHDIIQSNENRYGESGHENDYDKLYGMGNERTVQDWINYTGVDYFNQFAEPRSYQGLTQNASKDEIKYKVGKGYKVDELNKNIPSYNVSVKMQKNPIPSSKLKISPMGVKKNVIINKQNGLFQLK
jgi:[Skp1-protein]-hydroxyproline N-acetylglucosaminyltransferase